MYACSIVCVCSCLACLLVFVAVASDGFVFVCLCVMLSLCYVVSVLCWLSGVGSLELVGLCVVWLVGW